MLSPIVSHPRENTNPFNAAIRVARHTVLPGVMTGGSEPDTTCVVLRTADEDLTFTPAEACALAAALQAVAVHVMETAETGREAA